MVIGKVDLRHLCAIASRGRLIYERLISFPLVLEGRVLGTDYWLFISSLYPQGSWAGINSLN